jgi:hypothetical protein
MVSTGRFAPEAAGRKSNDNDAGFHSKADIAPRICHVRKVPKAEVVKFNCSASGDFD